jgi:tRNA threonylcarbamoyladenosine biosynthesis protein TsaB
VHVLILSLDTTSPSGSIAVLRDTQLLGVLSTTTDEAYSSRIFRQLEVLLAELQLTLDRFDLFAVNSGPGSFTGVRVGLTAAKAWSEAFGRPVVAVSGLEAVAAQAVAVPVVVAVMDARRGQLYTGIYRRGPSDPVATPMLSREGDDRVMTPEEFCSWLRGISGAAIVTPSGGWLASLLAPHWAGPGSEIHEVSPVLAPMIGRLAFDRARRGETLDGLRLDANYVRRSDAELNWKGKQG